MFVHDVLQIANRVRGSWRDLVVTDIAFKVIAFVVLTPVLGLCQRLTIWLASDGLLSDTDFIYLFTHPVGLCCGILVASVWLAIRALEQASLLSILGAKDEGKRLQPLGAVRFAMSRGAKIWGLTGILIGIGLLVLVPFLIVALLAYRGLLGEYDINYYLQEQPSEFVFAVCIGACLALIALGTLLWVFSAWLLALPIVLFESQSARLALRSSRQTLIGHRGRMIGWLAIWLLAVLLANLLLATLGGWVGSLLIPSNVSSLVVLATRVGVLLLVLAGLGLVINIFATITFASLMDTGYQLFRSEHEPIGAQLDEMTGSGDRRYLLTRGRLAVLLVIGALVAAWIGVRTLKSLPLEDNAMIMAHRGASADAPENTMAAFQMAIDGDADWIEIDVQESADGDVIVIHDSDFMKQSGNPLKVWDSTREELASIDIGSWFDPQFADQRVATLQEVLELCRDRVGVNIELKYYDHDEQLEQRVVEIVEAAGMADQVMVMSLKKNGVVKTKELRPDWKCGLLLSVHAGNLEDLDVDFLAINSKFASRSFVRRAQAAGKEVYVWTVNDVATMSQMLNRGVDGLLTDKPALARQVLSERAEMSLAERLLSELSVYFVGSKQPTTED